MSQPPVPPQSGQQDQQMPFPPQQPTPTKKKWYKRPLTWIIAAIVVIAMAVNGGGTDSESATTDTAGSMTSTQVVEAAGAEEPAPEPEPVPEPEPAEERTPMTVSAETMIDDLESNALKAETTYKGQYVTVTGYVSNIDAQGKYFSVDGGPDTFTFTGVQAFITPEQKSRVAEFSTGDQVTFTGEVTKVGEIMGYSMDVDSIQ